MKEEEFEDGTIVCHEDEGKAKSILRISGLPKVHPNFVNKVDKSLWDEYWDERRGNDFEIRYIPKACKFNADKTLGIPLDVEQIKRDMCVLVRDYSKSAQRYNEKIADPFINERKSLLSSVFEGDKILE